MTAHATDAVATCGACARDPPTRAALGQGDGLGAAASCTAPVPTHQTHAPRSIQYFRRADKSRTLLTLLPKGG